MDELEEQIKYLKYNVAGLKTAIANMLDAQNLQANIVEKLKDEVIQLKRKASE